MKNIDMMLTPYNKWLCRLGDGFFYVLHIEQMLDAEHYDHSVFQRNQAAYKGGIDLRIGGGSRLYLVGFHIEYVGDGIDQNADSVLADGKDDDDMFRGCFRQTSVEPRS